PIATSDPAANVRRIERPLAHLTQWLKREARQRRDIKVHVLHDPEIELNGTLDEIAAKLRREKKSATKKPLRERADFKIARAPNFAERGEVFRRQRRVAE